MRSSVIFVLENVCKRISLMSGKRLYGLKMMLIAVLSAMGFAAYGEVTVYSNCFSVVSGETPRIACSAEGLEDIEFTVDSFTSGGWTISKKSVENIEGYIARAEPGTHVLVDNIFSNRLETVSGVRSPAVIVFYNWYRSERITWCGFISIDRNEEGDLAIVESAVWKGFNSTVTVTGTAEVLACGSGCFRIEDGSIPHLVCAVDGLKGIDFAVDSYGSDSWRVTVHHTSGWGCIESGVKGMRVTEGTFERQALTIEATGETCCCAFWWYSRDRSTNIYGWFKLGTVNGQLVVLDAELADSPNTAEVDYDGPNVSHVDCFRIDEGNPAALVCMVYGLGGIKFDLVRSVSNDWQVACGFSDEHRGYIEKSATDVHSVGVLRFDSDFSSVNGSGEEFVFEFGDYGRAASGEWYGYVKLALDANAKPTVVSSAICNKPDVLRVSGTWDSPCSGNNLLKMDNDASTLYLEENPDVRFRVNHDNWSVFNDTPSCIVYFSRAEDYDVIDDSMFVRECDYVAGSDDVFTAAFRIESKADGRKLYGWVKLCYTNDAVTVLAQGASRERGEAVVGVWKGMTADDIRYSGDVIWESGFDGAHDGNSVYAIDAMKSRFIRGFIMDTVRENYKGRSCAELDSLSKVGTAWFSLNEIRYYEGHDCVGEMFVPTLWQSVGISFRIWSLVPSPEVQPRYDVFPRYGILWKDMLNELSSSAPDYPTPLGSVINIDDKISLRYQEIVVSQNESRTNWVLNAGIVNSAGELEEATVELVSSVDWLSLPAGAGRWTSVKIEAENDASPFGLALRIYIDGIPAESMDGCSVFRSRPGAVGRTGVSALGIGGLGYLDDLAFFTKTRNFTEGVLSYSSTGELTESEKAIVVALVGREALRGFSEIEVLDGEGEPEGAGRVCLRLGVSPEKIEVDGEYGRMRFKSPAVRITSFDIASRTITAKVEPAEGTRIAAPPRPNMFGVAMMGELGTLKDECGNLEWKEDFELELSHYLPSNGVFSIRFPEWFMTEGSSFYQINLKNYQ